jgi:hypothetical protein
MTVFRFALAAFLAVLVPYTVLVISRHGLGLLAVYFGDIARMDWPGQFNLDFFGFLLLSGLWTAWRNAFSPAGLGLALVAVFGGMGFLASYLLILAFATRGDIRVVLLGPSRSGV